MIILEFSAAAAIYLSLAVMALLLYWAFFEKPKSSGGARSAVDRHIWQCAICTYFYIDSRHSEMSVCPRCGSYNKKAAENTEKEEKQ